MLKGNKNGTYQTLLLEFTLNYNQKWKEYLLNSRSIKKSSTRLTVSRVFKMAAIRYCWHFPKLCSTLGKALPLYLPGDMTITELFSRKSNVCKFLNAPTNFDFKSGSIAKHVLHDIYYYYAELHALPQSGQVLLKLAHIDWTNTLENPITLRLFGQGLKVTTHW